jgi:hypothetical protein
MHARTPHTNGRRDNRLLKVLQECTGGVKRPSSQHESRGIEKSIQSFQLALNAGTEEPFDIVAVKVIR